MIELHFNKFNIHLFFDEIFRIFSRVAKKKNVIFSIVIDENIPDVIFNDNPKLRRVIFNLLSINLHNLFFKKIFLPNLKYM
jgi:signal transduction histidine kinase